MEDLATIVREAMARKQMSTRDVANEAERLGHTVSFSLVSKTTQGNYTPGEPKLVGLAVALDIPIERLRAAAGVQEPGTPFRLPEYASRLSPAERAAIEHTVRVMVEAKDQRSEDHADGSAATSQHPDEDSGATMNDYGLAAHPEKAGPAAHENLDEQG